MLFKLLDESVLLRRVSYIIFCFHLCPSEPHGFCWPGSTLCIKALISTNACLCLQSNCTESGMVIPVSLITMYLPLTKDSPTFSSEETEALYNGLMCLRVRRKSSDSFGPSSSSISPFGCPSLFGVNQKTGYVRWILLITRPIPTATTAHSITTGT